MKANLDLRTIFNIESGAFYKISNIENASLFIIKDLSLLGANAIYLMSNNIISSNLRFIIADWNHLSGLCSHIMNPFLSIIEIIRNRNGSIIFINMEDEPYKSLSISGEISFYIVLKDIDEAVGYINERIKNI